MAKDRSTGTNPVTALKGTHRDLTSELPDLSLFHLQTNYFVILEDVILLKPRLRARPEKNEQSFHFP